MLVVEKIRERKRGRERKREEEREERGREIMVGLREYHGQQ